MGTRLTGFMGRMGLTGFSGLRGLRCACLSFIIYHLIFILSLPVFTSCSSDSDDEEVVVPTTEVPIEVMSYTTWFEENVAKTRAYGAEGAGAATRAWIPPTGFTQFAEDQKIGVCLTQDDQEPKIGHFFKSSGKWKTNVEIPDAATYYLYGYTPHNTGISCEVTDLDGAKDAFSSGSILKIKNLPAITSDDVCVVIGAKNGKEDYSADADYSVKGLRRGDFAYDAEKVTTTEASNGNYVYMLFDHLYSALRLNMRVDTKYDEIRTIKLKEITLSTQTDDEPASPTKKKTDITIRLNANLDGSDPIESVTYTPTGEETGESSMFHSDEGLELTKDYSEYICHFMPQGVTTLILTSTFDIYDKHDPEHPEGNLIRKNAKATNTLVLGKLLTGQDTARRGSRYTFNITIKPTYLYQMSDPDLADPSMVVE